MDDHENKENRDHSTTFGYDRMEDRVWLSFNDGSPRVWLTRGLVKHLLGPMLASFERTAPGAQAGGSAQGRLLLEHRLAMDESLPGQRGAPMRMGSESSADSAQADYVMCTGVTARFDASRCSVHLVCRDAERVIRLSRTSMHRWLRGLRLVSEHAQWDIEVPDWLRQSVLPPALASLLVPPPAGLADHPDDPDEPPHGDDPAQR